jgi:hypothetical protein
MQDFQMEKHYEEKIIFAVTASVNLPSGICKNGMPNWHPVFVYADGGIRIHYIFKNAVKSMVPESAISFLS